MAKYRKKPVVIDAIQWTGHAHSTIAVDLFLAGSKDEPTELYNNYKEARIRDGKLLIKTLEGLMEASVGDWIIKGVKGEFYPCKPDIFDKTYERVEDATISELETFSENRNQ